MKTDAFLKRKFEQRYKQYLWAKKQHVILGASWLENYTRSCIINNEWLRSQWIDYKTMADRAPSTLELSKQKIKN